MSDRLAQLRSLADGVGDLQHGQPGDEDHCTAADVIRWAVAEIERHRMTEEERVAAAECAIDSYGVACNIVESDAHSVTLRGYLDRTAPELK